MAVMSDNGRQEIAGVGTPLRGGTTRTVLVALSGESPGVITETVWALAHERPRIVPDQVVVVTTASGRRALAEQILENGVWQRLRRQLDATPGQLTLANIGACVRVIPTRDGDGELEDIRTGEDNEATADFLLETLRGFAEHPDMRLIVSVAGGRKTMGLLAGLALSLIGRHDDRLCHVLVNPPFDRPNLEPRFCFPDASIRNYRLPGDERRYTHEDLDLTLADIPFVPLRYLFAREFARPAGSFMETVAGIRGHLACGGALPEVRLAPREFRLRIDGVVIPLSALEFAVMMLCAGRALAGNREGLSYEALYDELGELLGRLESQAARTTTEARDMWREKRHDVAGSMRRIVSNIKRKIGTQLGQRVADLCALTDLRHRGRVALRLPPQRIIVEKR